MIERQGQGVDRWQWQWWRWCDGRGNEVTRTRGKYKGKQSTGREGGRSVDRVEE